MKTDAKPSGVRGVGAEPLPGYRLIEPLGRGGFGEVWKCEVPGGLLKAIKFVKGPANAPAAKRNSAEMEFRAIQRVKTVRHPFVLSIERVEVVAGELILVMELADRNLADCLAECQTAGQPGIAREELLAYLMEAAEALDVINFQHGLQHLDVKPGNLFVVGNHLKVADFGLVNTLDDVAAAGTPRHLGGLTPLYVAPEMLRGKVSRHSDQYSLAVVYQELLTGMAPFAGDDPAQVMQAHLEDDPDLSPLPEADRPAVARALAKDPELRFPSCLHFLQALVNGPEPAPTDAGVAHPPPPARSSFRTKAIRFTPIPPAPGAEQETIVTKMPQHSSAKSGKPASPSPDGTGEPAAGQGGPHEHDTKRDTGVGGVPALAGYEMVTHLSSGPLGELYKARDVDGHERHVRFLPDPADTGGLDAPLLARLSSLRDPALPRMDTVRTTDGRSVLLSDPVEYTLQDRYRECVAEGMKGVPRAELLGYLAQTAKALDGLRRRQGLWHLGLGPRALWLADGAVKLGDFGLADLLWLPRHATVPHFNRRYAAPELVRGDPNATCDAYSLALIYAEMLTGVHPWPNRMRSRTGSGSGFPKPDLDWLPAADREVIARALDGDPQNRFPCCVDLLDALTGTPARGCTPDAQAAPELPFVQPFANLSGGTERLAGTPSVHRIVTQLVLAETSAITLGVADGLYYLRRPDQGFEAKFPIRLLPGMVRLKMTVFAEKFRARIVSQDELSFVLQMHESETFWQRCLGKKSGLEVRLALQPSTDGLGQMCWAAVTVQPYGGLNHHTAKALDESGAQLLVSLRDTLQNTPDLRGQVRWPCSAPIAVYPVGSDRVVSSPLPATCKDVSYSGIGFWVAQRPTAKLAYLHFKTFPELEPLVLLVRIVRAEPCVGGGYKIGAAFAIAGTEGA